MVKASGCRIRLLRAEDISAIAAAFAALGWGKPPAQYEGYLAEQRQGEREVLVAWDGDTFVGYVTVVWNARYAPFHEAGIPEIADFNVFPRVRRQGIGSLLLDEAEQRIAERSHVAGIGVGMTATAVAAMTGYSAYWIGHIPQRFNSDGPDGVRDRRHGGYAGRLALPPSGLTDLSAALDAPCPGGDRWCGRTVAQWLAERLVRHVSRELGSRTLRRLGARWLKPRPRHVCADPQAQAEFKTRLRPLLRQGATAFPLASVELWAVHEHRIGLKPTLHNIWCVDGQRLLTPVQHRYDWRYLVGFVHPASGRSSVATREEHHDRAHAG